MKDEFVPLEDDFIPSRQARVIIAHLINSAYICNTCYNTPVMNQKHIEIKKLVKYYGKARGVTDVSFDVNQADFFGFIGPNGAGKSTTIRILTGLIRSSGGEAKMFGMDVWKQRTEILSHIGYLPSEISFYPGQSVRDVLELSARLHGADCKSDTGVLCERLKLNGSQKVADLSLGNRKKVGIVAALQHRPELIILDEPTSGLDPLMQHEFFEILKERNNSGATIFLSSHILTEVQNYCKRAAIIREGVLVACDDVDRLLKTKAKSISLKGDFNPESIPGCTAVEHSSDNVRFLYDGDIRQLLRILAESDIKDLSIQEPGLEEIFMHYYE